MEIYHGGFVYFILFCGVYLFGALSPPPHPSKRPTTEDSSPAPNATTRVLSTLYMHLLSLSLVSTRLAEKD